MLASCSYCTRQDAQQSDMDKNKPTESHGGIPFCCVARLSLSFSLFLCLSLSPSLSLHVKSVKTLNIAVAPIIRVSFSRKEKHDTKEPHKCAGCILGTLLLVVCIANMFGLSPCYQVPRLLSLSSQPGQGRLPHTMRHICLWHRSFGVICQLDNQLDEVLCRQYSKRLTVPSMFAHVVAEA